MNTNKVLLYILCFLLFSCGKNAEQIEATFTEMKQLTKGLQATEIVHLIDEDSKNYLMKIEELLRNKSDYELEKLGEKHKCELNTRYLYQLLEQPDSVSVEKRSLESMILFTQLAGLGILNPKNEKRLFFKEMDEVNGNKAKAVIRVRATPQGKHYINTKYKFTKEDDQWKINIPSTFSVNEKILKAKWNRSGGAAKTFISELINSSNQQETVQLKYRLNK